MKDMTVQPIKNLIICDPYKAPDSHWQYNQKNRKFKRVFERRPAGFLVATPGSKLFDEPGEFRQLELVNKIRKRVDEWREAGYPGVTKITKRLLKFWRERSTEGKRLFFCQLEAIETIIWFTEAAKSYKLGIDIPTDGGEFTRVCTKMATGTGKTIVMAMLIVWQVINKVTYPNEQKFSKNILVIAPGLTVKKRLEVLKPEMENNYYDEFRLVPNSMWEELQRGKIVIHNWHTLMPIEDRQYKVVKRGPESDFAFAKRILGFDGNNIIVINDEAHHAWRKNLVKDSIDKDDERTKWIEGLDKIHRERNIIKCHDFSATPFIPTGENVSEEIFFKWVISDFSLNDAIESGLTKTPRGPTKDDSEKSDEEDRSRFYHIYSDPTVNEDLNRRAKPNEELPDLIRNAYMLLGADWLATKELWDEHQKNRNAIPPVMVTVCNETMTSKRVEQFFKNNKIGIDELADREYMLRIDSEVLKIEKNSDGYIDSKNSVEMMRQKLNTVGKIGMAGANLRNIIAVDMITEGWDARNVTHIMGLRAFTSQLLCEQTVGRGLRRMSYDVNSKTKLFEPEYVKIFGVPFAFLPHETEDGDIPKPPKPTILIEPDPAKSMYEIAWPNVERISNEYTPVLEVDWRRVKQLELKSTDISTKVEMASIIDGKLLDKISNIGIAELKEIRMQQIVFLVGKEIYNNIHSQWIGNRDFLIAQLIKLTEQFLKKDKIIVTDLGEDNELRRRATILINVDKVAMHICDAIKEKSIKQKRILLNSQIPIKSTKIMRPWRTTKKLVQAANKNHINFAVYDSEWEKTAGEELEKNDSVAAWVKNEHIEFMIKYSYEGITHDYYPDFLIKLTNNVMLVLEIKGRDDEQNRVKRKYLKDWTDAVNENGKYGTWACDVAFDQAEVTRIIAKHSKTDISSKTYAKCPSCRKMVKNRHEIEREFGYRNVDGIIRPQSWCRECRGRSNK